MASKEKIKDVYGPGTFTDASFVPVPEESRRLMKLIASLTPGFTRDEVVLSAVNFHGQDLPIIPGPLKAQALAAALFGLTGVVVQEICKLRGIDAGNVDIDTDKSGLYPATPALVTVNGKNLRQIRDVLHATGVDLEQDVLSKNDMRFRTWAIYPTKDPKVWFQFLSTFDPVGYLKIFGLDAETKTTSRTEAYNIIKDQIQKFSAAELELKCIENGHCGQRCYTPAEWRATRMAQSLARHPLINYKQVKGHPDLPSIPFPESNDDRPLAGIRIVELARVIAAPAMGAALTALGAELIKVQSPELPDFQSLSVQLTAGKTTTPLNLNREGDRQQLSELIEDADVVIQAFRLGSLEKKGFGLEDTLEMAKRRGKGVVYLDLSCYGPDGVYAERPGFQQIADCASGGAYVMGNALGFPEGVSVLPSLPIADMLSGAVGVIDVLLALRDRAKYGGSYHAMVALTSIDDIQLTEEVGLYSRDIVKRIQDKFKFDDMTPDLHVEELLFNVAMAWAKHSDLLTREGYMVSFPETAFGKGHTILGPVLKFQNESVGPRWTHGPVPYCSTLDASWSSM